MTKRTETELLNNVSVLSSLELRTLNRYYLHPLDKRCCGKCHTIFDGISENFHVKKYYNDGRIGYNIWCKRCKNEYNQNLNLQYRTEAENFIRSKLASYRHRAKTLNVPFNITTDYLISLWNTQNGICFYTGEIISFTNIKINRNAPHLMTPSLDRLETVKGYTIGNVVWCSYKINRMKNELPFDEFMKICELILENQKRRK